MTKTTLPERLGDTVVRGDRVASHSEGVKKAAFEQDLVLQDAVVRCLEVIGEAARHIMYGDAGLAESSPGLKQAYRTRKRIARGYFDVGPTIVWETATVSIPKLVQDVLRFIAERGL